MNVYKYEEITLDGLRWLKKNEKPTVFLAGPTVRGHQQHLQPSWRYEAVDLFWKHKFEGNLIVPEFEDVTRTDKGRLDLPIWEMTGMQSADIILFWIARTKELIALCTNFEMGYWIAKDHSKVVYGRPDDSYRNEYNDVLWKHFTTFKILTTLEDTVVEAKEIAELRAKLRSE